MTTATANKVTIDRQVLLRAVRAVLPLASKRTTLPITNAIRIAVFGDRMTVEATDLTQSLRIELAIDGEYEVADIALPAGQLAAFLGALSAESVSVAVNGQKAIFTGGATATINGYPGDDFPPFPVVEGETFTLASGWLQAIAKRVAPAASVDESQERFRSVDIRIGDPCTAAAMDGFRLAIQKFPAMADAGVPVNIPAAALSVADRMATGTDAVHVTVGDHAVMFKSGNWQLAAVRSSLPMPDYMRVIPAEFCSEFVTDADTLAEAVRVVRVMAGKVGTSEMIRLRWDNAGVVVYGKSAEAGECTAPVAADVSGAGRVALNPAYLLDALSALSGGKVWLRHDGESKPVMLNGGDSDEYRHVIMAMFVNWEGE